MARTTVELEASHFDLISPNLSPFSAYGLWNSIVAFGEDGSCLGWAPAHDGDFFPESVMDYVEACQTMLKGHGLDTHPVRVDIDITQVCNSDCTFCFSRPYQKSGYRGAWIPETELRRILKQCAMWGTKTVRYCGGGEPLLHPEIRTVLKLPREYGLKLCVITNGDLIDEELVELITDNVDHLRWSVNASSDTTRRAIHRPKANANELSCTRDWIRLIALRAADHPIHQRTMIWATYLLLPENVEEVVDAAARLRDAKVNSISFRPVFHGYHSQWSAEKLETLESVLTDVHHLAEPPNFNIFVPKRRLNQVAKLNPNDYFSECQSRKLRTVIEATAEGALLQPCGMYRGNPDTGRLLLSRTQSFGSVWKSAIQFPNPKSAPQDCETCIDVSMNLTLAFIIGILDRDLQANFFRAWRHST